MMYFLGFAFGNLVVPKYMDTFGRKKVFVTGMYLQLATLIGMLMIPPHSKTG